jgi:phosphatidate phosphatase APP1
MSGSPRWLSAIARIASAVDDGVDMVRYGVRSRVGGNRTLRVATYRSYGTATELRVMGRVLRDAELPASVAEASSWENLLATYRRFETDEVPGARVRITLGDATTECSAGNEGYFEAVLRPTNPLPPDDAWHTAAIELLSPIGSEPVRATARSLVPAAAARFGIVSDIDDTVIQSDATALLRMARHLLLGNARTRMPFAGVAAFYRALQGGAGGHASNPLFYVSSSPWNLYDLLIEVFEHNGIPLGPLMLRDWGLTSEELLPTRHAAHKGVAIARILDTYPHLPFVLIGDSGQEDPEIYASIIRQYPGRILAAYIRSIRRDDVRVGAVNQLAEELRAVGGKLVLADDTTAAAHHAAEHGWIEASALPSIVGGAAADRATPA